MPRKTSAIIHLDAVVNNYQLASSLAPQSRSIAVIKANAYGHGSSMVAETLEPLAPAFSVAFFEEAITLREAGIKKPILILQGIDNKSELEYASAHDIWIMVCNEEQAHLVLVLSLNLPIQVWIKVDIGMHRMGLDAKGLRMIFGMLNSCPWVTNPVVVCAHLSFSSDPAHKANKFQLRQFTLLSNSLRPSNQNPEFSIANSAGVMGIPDSRLDWNRPGIMLYGLSPFEYPCQNDHSLMPAMTFTSKVIAIRSIDGGESVGYGNTWVATKPSRIATIAVGYADGYPRHAQNGTPLIINDQMASLAGRVSMDMITADIIDCTGISIGDPVELWGRNINANDVAQSAGTIGYDLVSGVTQRVPRIFHYADKSSPF